MYLRLWIIWGSIVNCLNIIFIDKFLPKAKHLSTKEQLKHIISTLIIKGVFELSFGVVSSVVRAFIHENNFTSLCIIFYLSHEFLINIIINKSSFIVLNWVWHGLFLLYSLPKTKFFITREPTFIIWNQVITFNSHYASSVRNLGSFQNFSLILNYRIMRIISINRFFNIWSFLQITIILVHRIPRFIEIERTIHQFSKNLA